MLNETKTHTLTFHPARKGLQKILGNLEAEIMETMWALGTGTVRDVHAHLNQERHLAYTTIMTVMSRLADKGLLSKEKIGMAFLYRPMFSREMFTKLTVKQIITGLLGDFSASTLNQLVETVETEDPDKIDELAQIIAEKQRHRASAASAM